MAEIKGQTPVPKRDLSRRKPVEEQALKRWWMADKDQVHAHLIQLVKRISDNQQDQRLQDVRHAYLYNSYQSSSMGSSALLPERYHVTYNIVKSAVDTVTAKLAQRELRPRTLTEGGTFDKQQRAKKLTKFHDGLFRAGGVYRLGPEVLKDACIFGTGAVKVIPDHECGTIRFERVPIRELLVDDLEAKYGDPQSLYQRRLVSRDRLMEMFEDKRGLIESAQSAADPDSRSSRRNETVDMVEVIEGWHLGEEGRHVIAIEGATLWDEAWEWGCFPFAFMKYTSKIDSFYGQGISEELMGTQLEINKLLRDIQRAQHLIAVPRVLMERSSKVTPAHLNNEIGGAIKYDGKEPKFLTPTAMNNEIYGHVKWLIASGFEKVGVSRMAATGTKPTGLDSRPALREYDQQTTERFAITEMNYRNFFEDLAKLSAKLAAQMYADGVSLEVATENRQFLETIKWSDVDPKDDIYVTKIYVSSLLPLQPSARLQKIEEQVRAGWMDRITGMQLMDHPDTEAWETLELADRQFVEYALSSILESGKYIAPEPEIKPEAAVNLARKVYLQARRAEAPPERLELLLRWIEAASSLVSTPVAPEAGPVQAVPQPLPESGLLPQAAQPPIV